MLKLVYPQSNPLQIPSTSIMTIWVETQRDPAMSGCQTRKKFDGLPTYWFSRTPWNNLSKDRISPILVSKPKQVGLLNVIVVAINTMSEGTISICIQELDRYKAEATIPWSKKFLLFRNHISENFWTRWIIQTPHRLQILIIMPIEQSQAGFFIIIEFRRRNEVSRRILPSKFKIRRNHIPSTNKDKSPPNPLNIPTAF